MALFESTPRSKLGRLLIVDDEIKLMTALCNTLSEQGYETTGFTSAAEALEHLKIQEFDVLITDMNMSQMDGMTLLAKAKEFDPHLVPIMMTGHGTIETAVEAMRLGAFDYVQKPLKLRDLLPVLSRALEVRRLRQENLQLKETLGIYELCVAIGFTLAPDTILNKVIDAAIEQCTADEASILLPSADRKELIVAAARGARRERILNQRIAFGESVAGWVARNQETLILNGPVQDDRFAARHPRSDIRSAISLPMMAGGQCVGVLNVNSTRPRRPFTLGQMKALTILTGTAAPALKAARLYAELCSSEERFRRITTSMLDFVCEVGLDGTYHYATPSCEALLGFKPEELVGQSIFDFLHPDDRPFSVAMFARIAQVEGPHRAEVRCRHSKGHYVWLESVASVLYGDDNLPQCVLAANRDISERKRSVEILRQSEMQFRQIWDKSVDGMRLTDRDGVICMVNDAFCRIVDKPRDALEGQPYTTAYAGDHAETLVGHQKRFAERSIEPYHTRDIVLWNGRRAIFELSNSFLEMPNQPRFLLSIIRDVTDQKNLETQLRQAQKMEAFGQLAGGVAHDFNNLLTVITGYSEMILDGFIPADKHNDLVKEIRVAGERAAALTRQLLAFSRKQVLQPVELDLNALVDSTEKMLRRLIGEDIDLATHFDANLGAVRADAGQLEQVILNLVVNARDAMPKGGHITIETRNVELDDDYSQKHAGVQPGRFVMLAVTDSGCGMDRTTQDKIFEPFFTTKSVGKGTGLGLATVHGIVKQSGGSIEVYSEVGQGTSFKVYLPRIKRLNSSTSSAPDLSVPPSGTETILIAEDEDGVRGAIKLALESNGYTVLTARNGDEAVEICRQHLGPLQLLITDVVMPKMSGRELAEAVRESRPDVKILFLSGYTDDAIVRHGVLQSNKEFLQKPFTPHVLIRKVRDVLDAKA